jgi:hypothetical protein
MVQSIGVRGYIASSPVLSLPQVLKTEVGIDKVLQISSPPFPWTALMTSFGVVDQR